MCRSRILNGENCVHQESKRERNVSIKNLKMERTVSIKNLKRRKCVDQEFKTEGSVVQES